MKGDIPKALLFLVVAALILGTLWTSCVKADGWFNDPPYVFLGLYTNDSRTYCHEDREYGHLGFGQNFYQNKSHEVVWEFQHNSCAFEENDRNSTNAIGVEYRLYLGDR